MTLGLLASPWAETRRLLGSTSDRARHVAGVGAAARRAVCAVPPGDRQLLVAAAWLHDIGYAPHLATTGFHPLDGARHLQALGAPARLCRLVANHTGAAAEADARGLGRLLAVEFPAEQSATADALTFADLTTGPTGRPVTAEERVAEILARYPADHLVHVSVSRSAVDLIATVGRVRTRLLPHICLP